MHILFEESHRCPISKTAVWLTNPTARILFSEDMQRKTDLDAVSTTGDAAYAARSYMNFLIVVPPLF